MCVEPVHRYVSPRLLLGLVLIAFLFASGVGCTTLHLAGKGNTNALPAVEDPKLKAFVEQQSAAKRAALVSHDYDLADLVASAQTELRHNQEDAQAFLADVLFQPLSFIPPDDHASERVRWSGATAAVLASPKEHAQIATGIQALREQGFASVVTLELRFLVAEPDELAGIVGGWTTGSLSTTDAEEAGSSLEAGLRARHVTDRFEPVRYKVLDDPTVMKVMEYVEGDRQSCSVAPPKMTVCGGQSAMMRDCQERPYVVAVENGRRKFRMISEGTTVLLRPLLQEDGRLQLECEATLFKIARVTTTTVDAQNKTTGVTATTIQVPEVERLIVNGSVEMRPDRSLLIARHQRFREPGEPDRTLMLLITARTPFADNTAKKP
ncbi:MAG: hypothetical protein JW818_00665 [Pirellulales bacterium]|nr:hypothetical protein [Pirellulales bacterium]